MKVTKQNKSNSKALKWNSFKRNVSIRIGISMDSGNSYFNLTLLSFRDELRIKFELISPISAKSQYNEKRHSVTTKILWNSVGNARKNGKTSPYCELNVLIGLWLARTPIKLFSYFWCFPFKWFVCHFVVVLFAPSLPSGMCVSVIHPT